MFSHSQRTLSPPGNHFRCRVRKPRRCWRRQKAYYEEASSKWWLAWKCPAAFDCRESSNMTLFAKCSNITEEWWFFIGVAWAIPMNQHVWVIALRKTTVVSSCWILASCDTTCVMMFCFAAPDILLQRRRNQYGIRTWCSRDFWSLSLSLPCPDMFFVAVSPLLSLKVATGHAHAFASSTMNLQVRPSVSKNCACSFKDCQPWHWTPHHWGFSKQNRLIYHQSEVCSKRESLEIICWSFTISLFEYCFQ